MLGWTGPQSTPDTRRLSEPVAEPTRSHGACSVGRCGDQHNSGTSSTTSLAETVVFGPGDDNPRSAVDNF
jgi:hypothetical protein